MPVRGVAISQLRRQGIGPLDCLVHGCDKVPDPYGLSGFNLGVEKHGRTAEDQVKPLRLVFHCPRPARLSQQCRQALAAEAGCGAGAGGSREDTTRLGAQQPADARRPCGHGRRPEPDESCPQSVCRFDTVGHGRPVGVRYHPKRFGCG